jgi:Fic family protein
MQNDQINYINGKINAFIEIQMFGKFEEVKQNAESYQCYIPANLSTATYNINPLLPLLDQANQGLGRIDALSDFIPDINLFIYLYVRKEALLSSQIEGTQSSLADLFMYENNIVPSTSLNDVEEVTNYVNALNYGLKRIEIDDFPISLRLIREIHQVLLSGVRGQDKHPGEFRQSQNWIGGTRPGNALFVPPPPCQVLPLLGDLENFIHRNDDAQPLLIKIALIHLQFESIHPFLDGNGRIGRLLVALLLCHWKALKHPILYISYYLKANRQVYYDLLQKVRLTGDWNAWISFFLEAVIYSCQDEIKATKVLFATIQEDSFRIEGIGKGSASVKLVFEYMKKHPITSITEMSEKINVSPHTSAAALNKLQELGIVQEISGKQRGKVYTYKKYLDILSEGSNPL